MAKETRRVREWWRRGCLLFNTLNGENPIAMLLEASRVVRGDGVVAVNLWRRGIVTRRGSSAGIRPSPEQIVGWAGEMRRLTVGSSVQPSSLPLWHSVYEADRPVIWHAVGRDLGTANQGALAVSFRAPHRIGMIREIDKGV